MEKLEIKVKELLEEIPSGKIVCLNLENEFNPSYQQHPLENYLLRAGILYYFGSAISKDCKDYFINLKSLKIIYPF